MRLSFVETMRGAVRDARGIAHPICFEVSAEGGGGGRFALRGIAKAPPWAREAAARGTLTIAPRARTITYALRFEAEAGGEVTLEAQKRLSLLAPLRSLTTMPVTVRGPAGEALARGEMSFDLRGIVPFLASWLPAARAQARRLDVRRRAVERARLRGA